MNQSYIIDQHNLSLNRDGRLEYKYIMNGVFTHHFTSVIRYPILKTLNGDKSSLLSCLGNSRGESYTSTFTFPTHGNKTTPQALGQAEHQY